MRTIRISVADEIREVCPDLMSGVITCRIRNSRYDAGLWQEFDDLAQFIRERYTIEQVNRIPSIRATRLVYKALGKDPNRYRPSAEALTRRVVKGMSLYHINTAVDLINYVSLKSGYSIGGFDAAKIEGDLVLGVGRENETFHGIGRGLLNIAGLPVYRDGIMGVGTPTSDEERTRLELETTDLLMIINAFSDHSGLDGAIALAEQFLVRYVAADDVQITLLRA